MGNQYIQDGELIDHTPGSAIAAAGVVVGTDRAFVAPRAIAANALGSVATSGVFQLAKTTGQAWTFGQKLFWVTGTSRVSSDANAGANKVIGYAAAAAATADVEGLVLLGT